MSKQKIFGIIVLGLFTLLFIFNWTSKKHKPAEKVVLEEVTVEEDPFEEIVSVEESPTPQKETVVLKPLSDDSVLPPDIDRMTQLFQPYPPLLPIVETVVYSSRVSWLSGRAAYLGDYASHYQTSKHFISRSLHGMENYLSDIVSKGDRFNVLRNDKELEFHLVLDLSRLKMWVYCHDKDENQRILLKSYPVCAGRPDSNRRSGFLTPLGTFLLGNEIAVYKKGSMGTYRNKVVEMVSVFGQRWIPLEREIANCTGSCKGLGIHGAPWHREGNEWVENRACIGFYESNGCIRLRAEDIEELFAVIISRPAYLHIVRDFTEASLPGKEFKRV